MYGRTSKINNGHIGTDHFTNLERLSSIEGKNIFQVGASVSALFRVSFIRGSTVLYVRMYTTCDYLYFLRVQEGLTTLSSENVHFKFVAEGTGE